MELQIFDENDNIIDITKIEYVEQMLVKKYEVTKSGSNSEIAERLVNLRGAFIKNKTDRKIIEQFLKKSTPSTKRWGFIPAKA